MKTVTITEDQAIGRCMTIDQLIKTYTDQGYTEQSKYTHPAVGLVVTLEYNPEENGFDSAVEMISIMETISTILKDGNIFECEILATALMDLKKNPKQDINQCLINSYNDWVK